LVLYDTLHGHKLNFSVIADESVSWPWALT